MPWNFGDILDAISPILPQDALALVHGERRITWGETTKRSNNLARALIERGLETRGLRLPSTCATGRNIPNCWQPVTRRG